MLLIQYIYKKLIEKIDLKNWSKKLTKKIK